MRLLVFEVILLLASGISVFAEDSLNINSSNKKWQIEILSNYNYNYRKTGVIEETLILQNDIDAINNYIDTGNIACYTKNIGILLSRKIWKPLSFQFGIIYGRKGYMHTRQLVGYSNGKGGFSDIYIKAIPEKMIIIPFNVNFIFPALNRKLKFGASIGLDLNLIVNQNKKKLRKYGSDYYFSKESYLKEETRGYMGFTPVSKLPENTKLLHEGSTMPFLQYNFGLFVQVGLYKSLFISIKYNYISQLGFNETNDYNLFIPNVRNQFKYEIKPYIHSFGIGLGFEF
jgi:hypothetical protein